MSLNAARSVVERCSHNVDGLLFLADDGISNSAQLEARSRITELASVETFAERRCDWPDQFHVARMVLDDEDVNFKVDTATRLPCPMPDLLTRLPVMSMIARCFPDLIEEYPELGGFELPVVSVALTATDKLEALHRRYVRPDFDGLRFRLIDVLDLASIATSEQAESVRQQIADIADWRAAIDDRFVARPPSGYGSSELYRSGTTTYDRLRLEYPGLIDIVAPTNPTASAPLDFDAAMAAAASLDTP